jgi:hypothetical protein
MPKKFSMLNYSFYNLKFRSQFLIAIILVPLFLLVVLNMVVTITPISNENEIKSYVAKHTSSTLLETLDRNFVERYGDAISFSGLETTINALNKNEYSEKLSLEMNKLMQNYPVYDLMIAVNLKGEVIACNTLDNQAKKINTNYLYAKNFANTNWFKETVNPLNKIWISDLKINPDSKKIYQQTGLGISFSAPIKSEKGKTIGVWYNLASWARITEANRIVLLKTLTKVYKNSSIVLTTYDNKIIDSENPDDFFMDFNSFIKKTQQNDKELITSKYAIENATEKGIGDY